MLFFETQCTILPLFIGPMNGSLIWCVNMNPLARYQIILLGERRHIGVSNLPRVVA